MQFRDTAKLTVVTRESTVTMDRSACHGNATQLQPPYTSTVSHPPTADTRRRHDDRTHLAFLISPSYRIIATGLRQRSTTRHIDHDPRQTADSTELTGLA